jgi:hypothetical protein
MGVLRCSYLSLLSSTSTLCATARRNSGKFCFISANSCSVIPSRPSGSMTFVACASGTQLKPHTAPLTRHELPQKRPWLAMAMGSSLFKMRCSAAWSWFVSPWPVPVRAHLLPLDAMRAIVKNRANHLHVHASAELTSILKIVTNEEDGAAAQWVSARLIAPSTSEAFQPLLPADLQSLRRSGVM